MTYINITRGKDIFKFHELLADNLAYVTRNQQKDWDFKILISGDGMTRTGKSTMAFQIASFLDEGFADNWKNQVVFSGDKLIEQAYKIGKKKVLVYDEAREGLDSKKQLESYTKHILDFFSQCGNLNHVVIIVLPDFFDLPKSISITTSTFLINCYSHGFTRGYFDFFDRVNKKNLYINGQKFRDYRAWKGNFKGTFTDYIPFDRKEYEDLKIKALIESRASKITTSQIIKNSNSMRRALINLTTNLKTEGFSKKRVCELARIDEKTLYNWINKVEGNRDINILNGNPNIVNTENDNSLLSLEDLESDNELYGELD